VILLALLTAVPASLAQDEAFVPGEALQAHLDELEAYVTDMRGLTLQAPITRAFPDRSAVAAFVAGQLDDPEVLEAIEESRWFYAAFGLIPLDIDILATYQTLLNSQIAGYYDSDTKTMNTLLISGEVPEDTLPLIEQVLYVHEFVHAVQDSNFDLNTIIGEDSTLSENPDRALAAMSLIEGEATYIMTEFQVMKIQENPLAALGMLAQLASGGFDVPTGTPDVLVNELLSPYTDGMVFVAALFNNGGWDAVNAAYANLPISTEQILSPEKYLAGELPVEVPLTDAVDALGAGWTALPPNTLGQFYLREMLLQQITRTDARRAASGWGGDRFQVYAAAEVGEVAYTLKLVMDDAAEAVEAGEGFTAFGNARYAAESADDQGCWADSSDALCVTVLDDVTLLVTHAPQRDQALALRDAQAVGVR
jgi:hypothetical protein